MGLMERPWPTLMDSGVWCRRTSAPWAFILAGMEVFSPAMIST